MKNSTAVVRQFFPSDYLTLAYSNFLEYVENDTTVKTSNLYIQNIHSMLSTSFKKCEQYKLCDFPIESKTSKLKTTSYLTSFMKEMCSRWSSINKFEELNQSLDTIHEECEDEGLEMFDEKARENARQIINILLENFPAHEYCVYPTEDREIAIYCKPQFGRSLLILSASDGKISFYLSVENESFIFKHDSFKNIKENLKFIFNKLEDGIAVYNLVTSTKFPK